MSTRRPKTPATRLRRTLARMAEDVTRFGRARRRTVLPRYDLSEAKRQFRRKRKKKAESR